MIETPLPVRPASEWPDQAVVDAARADPSWRPRPFTHYVVKLHGRCNLACDYCYMYEMADQSWRGKPIAMARGTIDRTASRVAEHLAAHGVSHAVVSFHGGEALLAGAEGLDYAATAFRSAVSEASPDTDLGFTVTTNGVLLEDPRILAVLDRHDIGVSLSLDGDRTAQDRHRTYANGRGSYDAVMRGVAALRAGADADRLRNLLCVIDLENDPIRTYESLVAVGSPAMDFLLPLGNWESTPPGLTGACATPYADWLIPIFDLWYATVPVPATVRLFDGIMRLALGGQDSSETIGLGSFQSLDIDTDGSIELVDALKSTFAGAPATGFDVFRNALDDVRFHPGIVARQRGLEALSADCLRCPVRDICGGGEYSTRYRRGTGFLNPSVYCADLGKLITHVRDRVLADVEQLTAGAGSASA